MVELAVRQRSGVVADRLTVSPLSGSPGEHFIESQTWAERRVPRAWIFAIEGVHGCSRRYLRAPQPATLTSGSRPIGGYREARRPDALRRETEPLGAACGLRAIANAELLVQRACVLLHGVARKVQCRSHFRVAEPSSEVHEDVALTCREGSRTCCVFRVFCEHAVASACEADGFDECGRRPILWNESTRSSSPRDRRADTTSAGREQATNVRIFSPQALTDVQPGLIADAKVHDGQVRPVTARSFQRVVTVPGADAARNPSNTAKQTA